MPASPEMRASPPAPLRAAATHSSSRVPLVLASDEVRRTDPWPCCRPCASGTVVARSPPDGRRRQPRGGEAPGATRWLGAAIAVLYGQPRCRPAPAARSCRPGRVSSSCASCRYPSRRTTRALLRVEACGICGSDAEQYTGTIPVRYPLVPGHEPLGVIEAIGDRAAKRWGVDVGDRVAVESMIPCGHCRGVPRRALPGVPRARRRHVRARLRARSIARRACGAPTPTTCTSTRARSCIASRADLPGEHRGAVQPARRGLPLGGRDAAAPGPATRC